ncbi:ABC-2 transporter permease [Clostridium frigidicarnis]|uniref:ABC-2 family transporter protein n=1 Tax=Clostridium frigidicarnis TaxID=84698 RepID=A0A1I1B9H4_9CLOT|nr:ABC-2 transporter permease [Clostridium frigidicarnis]SFB46747.1 ABC-2 family transporter protein [Clostridium frigidicarnis]
MISLFLKDFRIAKKSLIIIFLLGVIFPLIVVKKFESEYWYTYLILNGFLLMYVQLFFHEVKSIGFIASLPVNRKMLVISRYVNEIIIGILSILMAFIFSNVLSLIEDGQLFLLNIDIMTRTLLYVGIILTYSAISNPVLFAFYDLMSQTVGCLVFSFATIALIMTSSLIEYYFIPGVQSQVSMELGLFFIVSVFLYVISFYISMKIYRRKEF